MITHDNMTNLHDHAHLLPQLENMRNHVEKYLSCGVVIVRCHTPIFSESGRVGCTCEAYKRSDKYREWLEGQGRGKDFDPNFECPNPGKHPYGRWRDETDGLSLKQAMALWSKLSNATDVDTGAQVAIVPNVGALTGPSNWLVLDKDTYKEFYACDLEDAFLPDELDTAEQQSQSGGAHIVFDREDKPYTNANSEVKKQGYEGIDIRGVGGFVVLAPSVGYTGNNYEWNESQAPWDGLKPIPDALDTILAESATKAVAAGKVVFTEAATEKPDLAQWSLPAWVLDSINNPAPVGRRSEADWSVVRQLIQAGASDDAILAFFQHYPIGTEGAYAEKGDRYLSLTIANARAKTDDSSSHDGYGESPGTLHPTIGIDELIHDATDVASVTKEAMKDDKPAERKTAVKDAVTLWVLDHMPDIAKLDSAALARLKLTLKSSGLTQTWLDRDLQKLVSAEKAKRQSALAAVADDEPRYKVLGGAIHERFETEVMRGEELVTVSGYNPLCNFSATILADVDMDDGEEVTKHLAIAGQLATGEKLPEILIPAKDFEPMQWPVDLWGGKVATEPGRGKKDKVRHAMQVLSMDGIESRRSYTHTGWRVIDGQRVFLHAGGAVGMDGVSVRLPEQLNNYVLPDDDAIDAVIAMRESINLMDVAPSRISTLLFAMTYLAILCEMIVAPFMPIVKGVSGSFKSSYTAVFLNHFGAKFSEYDMPADWLATANSLEKLTFHAKDVLLIIDDLRPSTNPTEKKQLDAAVSRLARAIGNQQARVRLDQNSNFRRAFAPRGVVATTAEKNAVGYSVNSRMMAIDVEQGDIDPVKLSAAQKKRHVYGYAMKGFIQSVAEDWDELKKTIPERVIEVRTEGSSNGHHRRLPNATATLFVAFECAMSYALEIGAIDEPEAQRRIDECRAALVEMAEIQSEVTESEDPALKYMTIVSTLIAQNKAHLSGPEVTDAEGNPKRDNIGFGTTEKLGWHDYRNVYLLPGTYNTVCRYANNEGWAFPSDEKTLRKELDRAGYLTKTEKGKLTTKQREPGAWAKPQTVLAISFVEVAKLLVGMGFQGIEAHAYKMGFVDMDVFAAEMGFDDMAAYTKAMAYIADTDEVDAEGMGL